MYSNVVFMREMGCVDEKQKGRANGKVESRGAVSTLRRNAALWSLVKCDTAGEAQLLGQRLLDHLSRWRPERMRIEAVTQRVLQLGNLRHHGQGVLRLLVHLGLELFVFLAHSLDFVSEIRQLVDALAAHAALALRPRLVAVVVLGSRDGLGRWRCGSGLGICVHSPKMLVKILLSREALASVPLAVGMRAVDGLLGPAVLPMNLSLVSEKPARVGETGQILASLGWAAIGAFVLVHVLVPLALARECADFLFAVIQWAVEFSI